MDLLISLVVVLIVIGLLLYLLNLLPLDPQIRVIIHAVVIIFVILWLLSVLLGHGFPNIKIGNPALR
jgi:hypothetical protein